MAVDYPFDTAGFKPRQLQWGGNPLTMAVESVINGGIQTQGTPWKKWSIGLVLPPDRDPAIQAAREAFLDSLNGQAVRVNIWHWMRMGIGGRGFPMGTINTSGVQVSSAASQFATSIILKGCGNGKTFVAGDLFKVGNQVIMVPPGGATADGSGVMTVAVTGGLIAAASVNDAVTVVRPTIQCVLAQPDWRSTYNPGVAEALGIDFIEAR